MSSPVELFLNWSKENNMICNPSKCKELAVRKKYNNAHYNIRGKITELWLVKTEGIFFLIFVIAPGKITWKWLAENRLATAAKVKKFLFV